jgi:hypothetical protein
VNPNQRALPGLEEHAHPLAHHLNSVQFKYQSDITPTARDDDDRDVRSGHKAPTYRVPRSFDPPVHEHSLYAVAPSPRPKETVEGTPGRLAGQLHWRGNAAVGHTAIYPGEISYVARGVHENADIYRDEKEGVFKSAHPFPHTPGLMTSMFHFAHQQVQPDQTTVPVHSPDRSAEGEAWSKKVGPEHLRPKRSDDEWRPPAGTHPYERAGSPRQLAPVMEGQERMGNSTFWMRHANANSAVGQRLGLR